MIRHVVTFRWVEGATPEQVRAVADALSALPGEIPVIRSFWHGADLGVNDGNWDYAVTVDFDSVEDQAIYRDHPAHRAVIENQVAAIKADRAAVQFDLG